MKTLINGKNPTMYYKYRFKIDKKAVNGDYRPVSWPIDFPYWCSGESETDFILVAFVTDKHEITRIWPEAGDLEYLNVYEAPVFSSRFPCPPWYAELRMAKLQEKYFIFMPLWSWGICHVLVRKDGLGFCHMNIYADDDIPSISDVFVDPDARRKGIGNELLRDAEELARLRGFSSVFLWTFPDGWYQDWYYRHGYRHFPRHDKTPQGDVLMEKDFTLYSIKI